jgi:hypothetical protein
MLSKRSWVRHINCVDVLSRIQYAALRNGKIHMKSLCIATLAGIAAFSICAPTAQAADPEFCRDYARSAVEQSERAMHVRSCEHLLESARFSPEFRNHFDWCLNAHRHEADEERARRHEALERCEYR